MRLQYPNVCACHFTPASLTLPFLQPLFQLSCCTCGLRSPSVKFQRDDVTQRAKGSGCYSFHQSKDKFIFEQLAVLFGRADLTAPSTSAFSDFEVFLSKT
jgi:hypothetical protein